MGILLLMSELRLYVVDLDVDIVTFCRYGGRKSKRNRKCGNDCRFRQNKEWCRYCVEMIGCFAISHNIHCDL